MSKRLFSLFILALISILIFSNGSAQGETSRADSVPKRQDFIDDQILIQFRPGVSSQQANQILARRGLTQIRKIEALDLHVLRLPPGLTVEKAVEIYNKLPEVDFAEPNYILWAVGPTQTEVTDQWGLMKIQAPEAWDNIPDKTPVLLAIVDTGIDREHTDLTSNIWYNALEINGVDGIDDDGNGKVDDTWGWDFVNSDNDPFDDHMHGTAVSSTAAGVLDGNGVAGVCPWCQVMAVKVLDGSGAGSLDNVAAGITYAADSGAQVINLSLAGIIGSQALQNAVDYAWSQGVLVVAATGNDGLDTRVYPAAYQNALAVGATTYQDYRACFSNYGENYVSVVAPGEFIYTATPGQTYGSYSGTSLSAPHVTGLGGLILSQYPGSTNEEVWNLIEGSSEDLGPVGMDAYFGVGRINALRAVTGNTSPTTPPAGMFTTDLSATGYAHARKLVRVGNDLHLVWHTLNGTQYQVLYTTSSNNGENWSAFEVVFQSTAETYHTAMATDGTYLYVVFPTKHGSTNYRVFFTRKLLSGGDWSTPGPVLGGAYNAVRPDIFVDPSNGMLHLVGSSFDDAGYVYYTNSNDQGENWSPTVNVSTGAAAQNSRYASVHANGGRVTIAGRSVEFTFYGLIPVYRIFTTQSTDYGDNWGDWNELAYHQGLFGGEYGLSLAGQADQLHLVYEHAGNITSRSSQDGVTWSTATSLGAGAWPSITQAADGQAWAMWVMDGMLTLRRYTGGVWDPAEEVGSGNYPNMKLEPGIERIEWIASHCSGAPFRVMYGFQEISISENNPPVADDQSITTDEDTSIPITLTASDPDGNPLTFSVMSGPANGTLTGTAPDLTYTPNQDFNGVDSFTFVANDGQVNSNTATITITVDPIDDAPVADDQAVTTPEDNSIAITLSGNDPDGDDLTYSLVTEPSNGNLTGTELNLIYSPNPDFNGMDIFTFRVSAAGVDSNPATVTITVNPVNDEPIANDQSTGSNEDTSVSITLTGSDVDDDPLSYNVESEPTNGILIGIPPALTYTPNQDYFGPDSFTFVVNDGLVDSSPATISINVAPINDAPVADEQSVTTPEDTPVEITLTGSDVEGDTLEYFVEAGPANGNLSGNGQVLTYTPDSNFSGPDTIAFRVSDGSLFSDIVIVSITVTPVNDAPVANSQSINIDEDTAVGITLTGSDVDDASLTFAVTEPPTNGDLSGDAPDLTYTPNPDFNGSDSFNFIASDGSLDSNPATVFITVNPINDIPVAYDQSVATLEDTQVAITLNGSDIEGDSLTYRVVSEPTHGSVTEINPNWIYTPDPDYTGPDSFDFVANDGQADSLPATISITVSPGTIHVGDLDGTSVPASKGRWTATVIVTVHDQNHNFVPGATIEGFWSDNTGVSVFCTILPNGECSLDKRNLKSNVSSVIFEVTNITHGENVYVQADNDDPDDDSSGTAIQINKDGTTQDPGKTPPVASFTYDCDAVVLICNFDASGSSDSNGTITEYSWDFGDGNTGSGITESHVYIEAGTYTMTLTVTDNDGDSDTETQIISVGADSTIMYIGEMSGTSSEDPVRDRWNVFVEVFVQAAPGVPVEGALVEGIFNGGTKGDGFCITSITGYCTISKSNLKLTSGDVVFTITNLTHTTYFYDPSQNVKTSITISNPSGSY